MRRIEPNIVVEGNSYVVVIKRNKKNKTRRFNINKVGSNALCLARDYRDRIKRKPLRRNKKRVRKICTKTVVTYDRNMNEKVYKYLCFYADIRIIFSVSLKKYDYNKATSILEEKISNSEYRDFLK